MQNLSISRLLATGQGFIPGKAVKQGVASNEITPIAATSDQPLGIYSTPETITSAQTTAATLNGAVVIQGRTMALAGAAPVAAGASVVVDADGDLVTKAAAGWVVGEALTPAAAGEWFEILVNIRKEPA